MKQKIKFTGAKAIPLAALLSAGCVSNSYTQVQAGYANIRQDNTNLVNCGMNP